MSSVAVAGEVVERFGHGRFGHDRACVVCRPCVCLHAGFDHQGRSDQKLKSLVVRGGLSDGEPVPQVS